MPCFEFDFASIPARRRCRNYRLLAGLALLVFAGASAYGQASPTATREPVQVGGGFSFGSSDYTQPYIKGFTIYGDYPLFRRVSVEGEFHDQMIFTPNDIGESTALAGVRYSFSLEGRATLYVKAMGGIGRFAYQSGSYLNPQTFTYGAFGGGAGVEFRASRHINVRAIDIEYLDWPGYPPDGLSPWVATIGAAYRF